MIVKSPNKLPFLLRYILFISILFYGWEALSAQTRIFHDTQVYHHQTTKGIVKDYFGPIDISNCSSISVSFDFEFSLPWEGDGNMETPEECIEGCNGDPEDQSNGCLNCWDFLYAKFFIDEELVYTDLIGGFGTTNEDQYGTISLEGYCVSENSELRFEIWSQNWAVDEWVEFTNIEVFCWEDDSEITADPNPACTGNDIQLSETGGNYNTWEWEGPENFSSTDRNPIVYDVTGDNAGIYTLTVEDANNCEIVHTIEVEVIDFPELPDIGPYCVSDNMILLPNPIEGIGGNWSGPGVQNNLFTPGNAGIGTHTLTFTEATGNCSGTIEVEVLEDDDLNDPGLPSSLCSNDDTILLPEDIDGIEGSWSGNGVSNNEFDPADAGVGSHLITFTPTQNSCVDPLSILINIENSPTAIEPDGIDHCDDGTAIDLTEVDDIITGGNTGYSVTWYEDPDLNDEISNPSSYHPGPTTLYATVKNGNCTSDAVTVTINLIDVPEINPVPAISVCGDENGEITLDLTDYESQLNGNSGNPVNWYRDVSLTEPINNPSAFTTSTTTIYATVSNSICTSASESLEINVGIKPVGESTSLQQCGSSGQVEYDLTSVEGDVYFGGYDYTWYENEDTTELIIDPESFLTSPPTTVYVVFSVDGCRSDPVSVHLEIGDEVNLGDLDDIDQCYGEILQLEGPVINGMDYQWSGPNGFSSDEPNPIVTTQADATHSGTYTLTGTIGDCSDEASLEVVVHEEVTATLNLNAEILCNGDSNGSISAIYSGDNTAETYEWSEPIYNGQQQLDNLSAGYYEVTITDMMGCSAFANITISEPDEIVLDCNALNAETGQGAQNGSGSVYIMGGTEPYAELLWSGPVSGSDNFPVPGYNIIDGLAAGDYTITVTDHNGCESTCTFTIDLSPSECEIGLFLEQETTILCYGDSTASLIITIENGTTPYEIEWSDVDVEGENPDDLPAGNYSVTVTDADDCTASANITITEPEEIGLNCTALEEESSAGASDGIANVFISGGTEPYSRIDWAGGSLVDPVAGDNELSGLSAGNYTVTITDGNGCEMTCEFTIILHSEDCEMELDLTQVDSIYCYGDETASLIITIENGTTPYEIEWSDVDVEGENPDDLPAGNYSVTVTDADDCTASANITITEPEEIGLNCTALEEESSAGASDGIANVFISGGTEPYLRIDWAGGSLEDPVAGDNELSGLSAGNYTVTITDGNGCEATGEFTIKLRSEDCEIELDLTQVDSIYCYGDETASLELSISAGTAPYNIEWSDVDVEGENPDNLPAGIYSVTVTDEEGCTAEISIEIEDAELFEIDCSVKKKATDVTTEDGSVEVIIEGGVPSFDLSYTGPLSGNMSDVSSPVEILALSAGNYDITVTDAEGCTAECRISLGSEDCDLTLNLELIDGILCHGDKTASIRATTNATTGVLQFDWSDDALDGKSNPKNLGAGTYSLTITDENGCMASDEITITEPELLEITCEPVIDPDNLFVELEIQGGTPTYTYTLSGPISETGTYGVEGNYVIDSLSDGDYRIIVRDANGCEAFCEFTVSSFVCDLELDAITVHPSCNGDANGSIGLHITGAFGEITIEWEDPLYNGQDSISDLLAGNYSVTVTDDADCRDSLTLRIIDPAPAEVEIIGPDFLCENDTLVLTAVDTFDTYIWNDEIGTYEFMTERAGQHTLMVTNANGCTAFDTLNVIQADTALIYIRDSLCADESITVNGTLYDIDNPNGVEVIPGGSYDGCDSTIVVELYFYGVVDIKIIEPSCDGASQTMMEILQTGNAVLPIDIYYNDIFYITLESLPQTVTFPGDGGYVVRIVDDEGCAFTQNITVISQEQIQAKIIADSVVVKGDTVYLTADIKGPYESFRWIPESSVDCYDCLMTSAIVEHNTVFILEVVDSFGCVLQVRKVVIVSEGTNVYIPNAFTPNIDGVNDKFIVHMGPRVTGMRTMDIFDRWGNKVYGEYYERSVTDIIGWNGKYRGRRLNSDVYVYRIVMEIRPGKLRTYTGTLTLLN